MTTDLLILKGVLLLRRNGNTYQSKAEQLEEQREWFREGYTNDESLKDWIISLQEELMKTPEQKEAESREFLERLCQAELEELKREQEREREEKYYSPSCPWNAPGMSVHDFI